MQELVGWLLMVDSGFTFDSGDHANKHPKIEKKIEVTTNTLIDEATAIIPSWFIGPPVNTI